jgi:hypothetical protein
VKSGTIYAMTKGTQSTLRRLGVMTRACMKMSRRHKLYSMNLQPFASQLPWISSAEICHVNGRVMAFGSTASR